MAIGHEDGQLAEIRFDAHAPIGLAGTADLDPWSVRDIRDNPSMREGQKTAEEGCYGIGGDIDPILRNGLQRRIGWGLHVPAAFPPRRAIR